MFHRPTFQTFRAFGRWSPARSPRPSCARRKQRALVPLPLLVQGDHVAPSPGPRSADPPRRESRAAHKKRPELCSSPKVPLAARGAAAFAA
jgi:hypothetical protein